MIAGRTSTTRLGLVLVALLLLCACAGTNGAPAEPGASGRADAPRTGVPATPAGPATTPSPAPLGRASARYGDLAFWHCHPTKRDDLCDTADLSTTVVGRAATDANGAPTSDAPAVDPAVDCYYAYPTVDNSSTALSRTFDLPVNPLEAIVVQGTFAPYGQVCRLFAPRYEQVTGAGYRSTQSLELMEVGNAQIEEAFDHYLATENHGRPFVLIGHSQGTHHLIDLMTDRFDGAAGAELRRQLVSALLLGPVGMLVVPAGEVSGGTFSSIPLCTAAAQIGCVVAFDSYAAGHPPVSGGPREGMERACTNPADLAAGDDAVALSGARLAGATPGGPAASEVWPDHFMARCARDAGGQPYLEISAKPGVEDPRPAAVLERFGAVNLHVLDPNFAMADLLALVRTQGEAAARAR